MKTFGLIVPKGSGRVFDGHVSERLAANAALAQIILPLLEAWRCLRAQAATLGRQIIAAARRDQSCQLLMSIPGVGALTAVAFTAAIEEPGNFRNSRAVCAWIGLTTRRHQSGEVDFDGHISRRGDRYLRGLLYEAATVLLVRCRDDNPLRLWGLKLRERLGFKRATVALARKLAVVMHAMLKSGTFFDRSARAAA
jgi:transposase